MNILDHFTFENVGSRIGDVETPVPLVDIAIVEHNLKRWLAGCDKLGIANWPACGRRFLDRLVAASILDKRCENTTVEFSQHIEILQIFNLNWGGLWCRGFQQGLQESTRLVNIWAGILIRSGDTGGV